MNTQYRVTRSSNATRVSTLLCIVLLVALVTVPWWAGRAEMRLLSEVFLYLALASLWMLGLRGDDGSQVLGLVFDFDLCGWRGACEGVWAVRGLEEDWVCGIGSEQFAFSHVEFEV